MQSAPGTRWTMQSARCWPVASTICVAGAYKYLVVYLSPKQFPSDDSSAFHHGRRSAVCLKEHEWYRTDLEVGICQRASLLLMPCYGQMSICRCSVPKCLWHFPFLTIVNTFVTHTFGYSGRMVYLLARRGIAKCKWHSRTIRIHSAVCSIRNIYCMEWCRKTRLTVMTKEQLTTITPESTCLREEFGHLFLFGT